jgi:hypothetical protein
MAKSDNATPSAEEWRRRQAEWQAKALASFPYERIQMPGAEAYATWQRLKAEKRGAPVVLGGDEAVSRAIDGFAIQGGTSPDVPDKALILERVRATLALARKLRHPEDLLKMRAEEIARSGETENWPEPTGTWPDEQPTPVPDGKGVTVAFDILEGTPLANVNIAIIPTEDWTEVPAYLAWGGWNECPAPEYHVAALRSWRDRYGAELVGLSNDVMNVRVARMPATRDEALHLAREQYAYCSDIVDQGTNTLSALAATLMVDPWWYFWWD